MKARALSQAVGAGIASTCMRFTRFRFFCLAHQQARHRAGFLFFTPYHFLRQNPISTVGGTLNIHPYSNSRQFPMPTMHKDFGSAMLAYRNRPEGPIEPLQTNWSTLPANDNVPAEMDTDRQREITPSISEIRRSFETGATVKNAKGQIIRIGDLHFSDGTQAERALTSGPGGKLVSYQATLPVGAMLHSRERSTRDRGPSQQPVISSSRLADLFGVEYRPYIPGRRVKRKGKSRTADESRITLAEAVANTTVMPPVTKCPPGIANGSADASAAFLGLTKGRKGESGSIAWQDISSMIAEREMWMETIDKLPAKDRKVIDAAMTARNYHAVGSAAGYGDYYARNKGGGKRALMAANDNLQNAIKKAA